MRGWWPLTALTAATLHFNTTCCNPALRSCLTRQCHHVLQSKLATILQTGYQDLIQQITSSVTLASGTVGVPGLVRSPACVLVHPSAQRHGGDKHGMQEARPSI